MAKSASTAGMCDATVLELWAAITAMGAQVARAELVEAGELIGLAQVILRAPSKFYTVGLISRGPIWCTEVDANVRRLALHKLRANLPGKGLHSLLATPEHDIPGLLPLYTYCHLAELHLCPDISLLSKTLHGKWRNALRKAQGSGLRVSVTQDPKVLVALINKDIVQQRQKGYRNLPPKFLANWVRTDSSAFRIYRALMGPNVVAEMLFLDHAPGVSYQIGWSSGAGRLFAAHNLLMWQAISDFAKQGRARLDLGTLDTVNAQGLARFKLGTGAGVRKLAQTGLVVPHFLARKRYFVTPDM